MCGRVFVKSTLTEMVQSFGFADPAAVGGLDNSFPRYNSAPSLQYPIIVQDEPQKGSAMFVSAKWGMVPSWQKEATANRSPPVNARSETIATNGMFKRAYASKRCLIPIDGYFEWRDIHGTGKEKQPYAIAMKDGSPFALAGIYDIWRNPANGELLQTFCIVTCAPNELMATIHDRMPVILAPADYARWIGPDADPADLMKPFSSDLMTMWPIARKVGSPKNDTPDILDPIEL